MLELFYFNQNAAWYIFLQPPGCFCGYWLGDYNFILFLNWHLHTLNFSLETHWQDKVFLQINAKTALILCFSKVFHIDFAMVSVYFLLVFLAFSCVYMHPCSSHAHLILMFPPQVFPISTLFTHLHLLFCGLSSLPCWLIVLFPSAAVVVSLVLVWELSCRSLLI